MRIYQWRSAHVSNLFESQLMSMGYIYYHSQILHPFYNLAAFQL